MQNDRDGSSTGTRYSEALYGKEKVDQNTLNPDDAELNKGLEDDAYGSFDIDDSTLPSDNDDSETETGMDDVDQEPEEIEGKEKVGDVIIN